MLRKHLFLKLYQKGYHGVDKPLAEYIKDYDKSIPVKYYEFGKTERPMQKIFRNLDELFLHKSAITNIVFVVRYLKALQRMDKYEDISLQEIFEYSLLMDKDKDKFPKTEQFEKAYISDSRRAEIVVYNTYYRLLTIRDLGCTDLEFIRRVDDCLFNAVPSNMITLDNGMSLKKNPFINYNASNNIHAVRADLSHELKAYDTELRKCEESFLKRLKIPSNVLFDGNRFTVCIPDSPISLMFDVKPSKKYNIGGIKADGIKTKKFKKTNWKHYEGGVNIQHPTELQPAFINRDVSERCGSWWNGRTTWDYTWREVIDEAITLIQNGITSGDLDTKTVIERLELISFILLLKNGGIIKGTNDDVCDVIREYRKDREKINRKYKDVLEAQKDFATTLMHSQSKRGISLMYECNNGYVVATYKPYSKSASKKLDSKAVFFDKDFNQIGVSEFYSDFVVTSSYREKYFDGGTKNHTKLQMDMIELTFKKLVYESRIICIDYESFNPQTHMREVITLTRKNDGTQLFSADVYPPQLFKTKLRSLMVANSIETYSELLSKQIYEFGFADVNDYTKCVDIVMNNRHMIKRVWNDEFEIAPEFGALNHPNLERRMVQYVYKNKRLIDTEHFSALDKHVEFTDVDYVDARESFQYREIINNHDAHNHVKIMDYEENWLGKRRAEKQKMKYKKATDKRKKR